MFQEEATVLQKIFDYITAPINFVTEYFLFNWEENPDWLPRSNYVNVIEKKYRLVDVKKTHPLDLMHFRVCQGRFDEALTLAEAYDLPTDVIYQVHRCFYLFIYFSSCPPVVAYIFFDFYHLFCFCCRHNGSQLQ